MLLDRMSKTKSSNTLQTEIENADRLLQFYQARLNEHKLYYMKRIVETLKNKKKKIRRKYLRERREMVLTWGCNMVSSFLED